MKKSQINHRQLRYSSTLDAKREKRRQLTGQYRWKTRPTVDVFFYLGSFKIHIPRKFTHNSPLLKSWFSSWNLQRISWNIKFLILFYKKELVRFTVNRMENERKFMWIHLISSVTLFLAFGDIDKLSRTTNRAKSSRPQNG